MSQMKCINVLLLREGLKNCRIREHAHTSLGPPPFCEPLRFFFSATFLDYWGCLVSCETGFVKFWVNLILKKYMCKKDGLNLTN